MVIERVRMMCIVANLILLAAIVVYATSGEMEPLLRQTGTTWYVNYPMSFRVAVTVFSLLNVVPLLLAISLIAIVKLFLDLDSNVTAVALVCVTAVGVVFWWHVLGRAIARWCINTFVRRRNP
jgi:hypothetical protein